MNLRTTIWLIATLAICFPASAQPAKTLPLEATFKEYCFACHGDGEFEGDVNLDNVTSASLEHDARLVRKLMHVLDTREMPPEDADQLGNDDRERLLSELQPILHAAVANSSSHVRAPIRRMNRFQYNNAVVDLFDLNCIVFTLPERAMRVHKNYFQPETGKMPDLVRIGNRPLGKSQMIEPRLAGVAAFPQDLRAEHGYDNRGDHLSLSPLLMDEFLKLGQSITESPDFGPKRVGIWKTFFLPPKGDADVVEEVRNRLGPFLTKAFRRPADDALVDRYTSFVTVSLATGSDFTAAMKNVAAATISSPRFLYIYDRGELVPNSGGRGSRRANDSANAAQQELRPPTRIDDFELASRLSFFLWGSLPDSELLSLAAEDKLSQEETLNQQIGRMLTDRKVKRFCDSFPSQWLQLDRIVSSVPNREKFPGFYFSKYRASMHMMMEPLLLFETVLIENLPITQLIDSDFTYRSSKLENAYGDLSFDEDMRKKNGGGVTVLNFKRVPVTDRRTGGVITNAAVMTMTSGPERTQPITRGAWMAGVIFNDPPEPPPADVPPLAEKPSADEEKLTLRQRLAAHRERADCRGCHEQIDPLGFALENFNPIGQWRSKYENGAAVDSSGELFRQHRFSDVVEFKDAILAEKERFCRALAGHLLSFALARELGPADELALDKIVEATSTENYRMKSLIRHIILSEPFRTKS